MSLNTEQTPTFKSDKKAYMRNAAKKFYEKNSVKIIEYKKEKYKKKVGHLQPLKRLCINGYRIQEGRRLLKEKATNNKLSICIVNSDGETNIIPYMDFYNQYQFINNEMTLEFVDNSNDEFMLLVSMVHLIIKEKH
jgi:hypothetical protein